MLNEGFSYSPSGLNRPPSSHLPLLSSAWIPLSHNGPTLQQAYVIFAGPLQETLLELTVQCN